MTRLVRRAAPMSATGESAMAVASSSSLSRRLAEGPWDVEDVPRIGGRVVAAIVGLGVAWVGVSGANAFGTQLAWTAVGVAALGMEAAGGVMWLLAGWRRLRTERQELAAIVQARFIAERSGASTRSDSVRVASSSMQRYHRVTCQLARKKQVQPISSAQIANRGLRPCAVCDA